MKININLNRKLSPRFFILSQITILILGLTFVFSLHYILNMQYSQSKNPFEKGPVTKPPKTLLLELEQPEKDTLSYQDSIVVSGKTGSFLDLVIYSDNKNSVVHSNKDGRFSTVFELNEGINRIIVEVFDASGDKRTDETSVYYTKEELE